MPYSKTSWVDDSTPAIDAANLNNIEDGISKAAYAPDASSGFVPVGDGSGAWVYKKITNAEISATAAIAYSKLALTGSVVNADIAAAAAIAYSKLNLAGSIVSADIADGTIVNADIATAAAIAASKLSGFPNDATKALLGDGSWGAVSAGLVKLVETTLGSAATSISAGSIPTTGYRNILVTLSCGAGSDAALQSLSMRVNNDSASSYRWVLTENLGGVTTLEADGGAVTSARVGKLARTGGVVSVASFRIYDYASTSKVRGFTSQFYALDGGNIVTGTTGGSYATTGTAVSRVDVLAAAGNLPVGATLTVYGEPS